MRIHTRTAIWQLRWRWEWSLAIVASLALAGCGGASDSTPEGEFIAPVVEYVTVFEDEFNGDTLDTTKWNVVTGDGCPDLCNFGNNELQNYAAENAVVANGVLTLEGRRESDGSYTSARLNTKGKMDFRYGRIEVGARLPQGQGSWPAIWLLHSDPNVYGPWPLSGEIDIMEAFNPGVAGNNVIQSTTHYGLPTGPYNGTSSQFDDGSAPNLVFREYAVEWERDKLRFFVDGVHYQTQTSDEWYAYFPADAEGFYDPLGAFKLGPRDAPFDQDFHLILNLAIGGNPVGNPDPATIFPQGLEIDYVRIRECANANPDTGRGCGSGDVGVIPLEDNDGGPLANAVTAQPFMERLDLYENAPAVLTLVVGGDESSNTLQVDGFTADGATVVSDVAFVDPDDAENTVWNVEISGGVANVFLGSEVIAEGDPLLTTGFNFSGNRLGGVGGDPVGEVAFDMQINSMSAGANILVKLDSGFPNVGEFIIPASELAAIGTRKTYSVKFSDFIANPGFVDCCGGTGVDLANIINPFVFEVQGGDASVYLDNIFVTNACKVVGACGADLQISKIPDLIVFDDSVNTDTWTNGIVASDSGSGFSDYTDPSNTANKVNWAIVADDDTVRGDVVEVTFNDSNTFGVWFFQSATGVDLSAYSAGALVFDIKVVDYGTNTTGMTLKVDCFFPCTSGDLAQGVIADGEWETITIAASTLTAGGLDISSVNTGLVMFPSSPQTGGIVFRVDNIRWVAETTAPPLAAIDLPVDFEGTTINYALADFAGASSALVADPEDAGNNVIQTIKTDGAETFAGTVVGSGSGFANPVPIAVGETLMNVRVRAPAAGIPVLLKIETSDAMIFAEVQVTTTAADSWETLSFDFSTVGIDTTATYTQAIIFFDFGNAGIGQTYFWDDVRFGAAAAPPPATVASFDYPLTFDDSGITYGPFGDFGGATTVQVADPDFAGNQVAQTIKSATAETFAGTVIGTAGGFLSTLPFSATETTMRVRVKAPVAGTPVTLKVETEDAAVFAAEVAVNTTRADTWETLTFDFSTVGVDINANLVRSIIFFDLGNAGDDSVYLWDYVQFGTGYNLPVTYDDPGVTYGPFGDFGNAATIVAVDPDDANNMVAQTTKATGSEVFAGTVVGTGDFLTPIPLTATESSISVRVRAPAAGIPVTFKIENSDASVALESTPVNTTAADTWETLIFNFSGADFSVDYVKGIVFFDLGGAGNDAVYYWDDVQFGDGS